MANPGTPKAPLNPFTLRFNEPGLEERFEQTQRERRLGTAQLGLGGLVLLFIILTLYQILFTRAELPLNLGYALAGLLTLVVFSSAETDWFRRHHTAIGLGLAVVLGVGLMIMDRYAGTQTPVHRPAMLLLFVWLWGLSAIEWRHATPMGWLLVLLHPIALLGQGAGPATFTALVLTAGLMTVVGYRFERSERLLFAREVLGEPIESGAERAPADWAAALKSLALELADVHQPEAFFERLLGLLEQALPHTAAAVGLAEDDQAELVASRGPMTGEGWAGELWSPERLSRLTDGRTVLSESIERPLLSRLSPGEVFGYRLDIPVFAQGRLYGVVTLMRGRYPFSDYETKLASSLVFHAMLAFRNARARLRAAVEPIEAREQLRDHGPVERARFMADAEALFETQDRDGRPVAMLLAQVDGFEELIERLGEEAAGQIQESVAVLIAGQLAEDDLFGAYEDGIFAVATGGTLEEGKELAERLRLAVAERRFEWRGDVLPITLSIGVSASTGGGDFRRLLKGADMGLFLARDAHGNAVRVSL